MLRSRHSEANRNSVDPTAAFGRSPLITSRESTPARNYGQAAYVLAKDGARLHELLMEAQQGILEMFFFYGIFTDASTRRRARIGSKTVKATLENFALVPHSHMNVEYQKGSSAPGILANLDLLAIEEVDMVESTPSYYRREQVNLLIALRNGKFLDTLVKVNFYTMQLQD